MSEDMTVQVYRDTLHMVLGHKLSVKELAQSMHFFDRAVQVERERTIAIIAQVEQELSWKDVNVHGKLELLEKVRQIIEVGDE